MADRERSRMRRDQGLIEAQISVTEDLFDTATLQCLVVNGRRSVCKEVFGGQSSGDIVAKASKFINYHRFTILRGAYTLKRGVQIFIDAPGVESILCAVNRCLDMSHINESGSIYRDTTYLDQYKAKIHIYSAVLDVKSADLACKGEVVDLGRIRRDREVRAISLATLSLSQPELEALALELGRRGIFTVGDVLDCGRTNIEVKSLRSKSLRSEFDYLEAILGRDYGVAL